MKGLSITGLVLGGVGPIVLLLPLILGLTGDQTYWQVGWVLFFLTIPVGMLLQIAAAVLVIIAASLALKRWFRPRSIPIVGISLTGAGLLVQFIGLGWVYASGDMTGPLLVAAGIVISLTGVIMSAIAGLRASTRWGR